MLLAIGEINIRMSVQSLYSAYIFSDLTQSGEVISSQVGFVARSSVYSGHRPELARPSHLASSLRSFITSFQAEMALAHD